MFHQNCCPCQNRIIYNKLIIILLSAQVYTQFSNQQKMSRKYLNKSDNFWCMRSEVAFTSKHCSNGEKVLGQVESLKTDWLLFNRNQRWCFCSWQRQTKRRRVVTVHVFNAEESFFRVVFYSINKLIAIFMCLCIDLVAYIEQNNKADFTKQYCFSWRHPFPNMYDITE